MIATDKPLAVSMGEPSGIGGEITLKTWMSRGDNRSPAFFALDDPERLRRLASSLDWPTPIIEIGAPGEAIDAFERGLPVLETPLEGPAEAGKPNPANAPSVVRSIDEAIRYVIAGDAAAMVTNPIHKRTLYDTGFPHPGHTEYLADKAGVPRSVMMLACPGLRVVPVTGHMSLAEAVRSLSQRDIVEVAQLTADALRRDFGIDKPHLMMAALNPHAGESGAMGVEEREIISPAVEELKSSGLTVTGPVPADTLFHERARAGYDAAICMYHDQALIPLKTIDFHRGVNVTLGLPFIRTSPDHGTAFEIAGLGIADESSLVSALRMASVMAANRAMHGWAEPGRA